MAYAFTGATLAAPIEERMARPSLFARIYAALIASRERAAQRQINARAHLIGESELIIGGFPQATLADGPKLPFAR
jgi:hypothetical protein